MSLEDTFDDLIQKLTVAPGIEVPDSRFKEWFPTLNKHLVIADSAVSGRVVFGEELDLATNFNCEDLAQITCSLTCDGAVVASGVSSEVLGNPLHSIHWLIKKLDSHGKIVKAGQRIASGTFIQPLPLTSGTYKAEFSHNIGVCELQVV